MDSITFKRRKSIEAQRDMISDLPRDVLDRIMALLHIRDAARMSVLSHKWRAIWTTTPFLSFDRLFFSSLKQQDTHLYSNIVSNILLQHEGPILKFSMYLPNSDSTLDISPWVSYVSRNGLKDFSLCNVAFMSYNLSSRLFFCVGLEKLKLTRCMFNPPPTFRGYPKLMSLELVCVALSCSTFRFLMDTCSALQKLVMTECLGLEQRNVVIDSPKLRILVLDWRFESLELKSCENLVSVSIGMISSHVGSKSSKRGLLKALANSSKLERLCIRGHFCRVLFKELSLPNTFIRLKILEFQSLLIGNEDDFSSFLSCVQSFSNIETLKISVMTSSKLDEHVVDFKLDCTLRHLRFAAVEISRCSIPELKLVEFLLACSPVLEKLSVLPTAQVTLTSLIKVSVQLNRFCRASPKVEVICPEPRIPVANVTVANVTVPHASPLPSEHNSSDSSFSNESYYSDSSA